MKASRIYETVVYAADLEAAAVFYQEVLGMELLRRHDLVLVFDCDPGVLLIFDPAKARQSGRDVPSHGPSGPGHLAFSCRSEELASWRQQLAEHGVEIEAEVDWGNARSIYFRDPAGNSLEFVGGELWRN